MTPTAASYPILVWCTDAIAEAGIQTILSNHPGFVLLSRQDLPAEFPCTLPPALLNDGAIVCDFESGMKMLAHLRTWESMRFARLPKVLFVTWRKGEVDISLAIDKGAHGYVSSSCSATELLEAVSAVLRGLSYFDGVAQATMLGARFKPLLTERERTVLYWLTEGISNKLIGAKLGISEGTVKCHVKSIFDKLDCSSRTEAAMIARRRGMFDEDHAAMHGPSQDRQTSRPFHFA